MFDDAQKNKLITHPRTPLDAINSKYLQTYR